MNDGEATDLTTMAMHLLRDVSSVLVRREVFLDTSGNGFNAFDSLRLSREKFHSRMIGALLSPESRHGLGTLFLQRFLEMLGLTRFPIPEDKRGVSITTEKYIGEIEDGFECGGIIDILIESDRWCLAIENKIDESDRNNQPQQLYRYWNWVKTRRPDFAVVYLTPSGKTAPMKSTGEKLEADKDYIRLSYGIIADWIDLCIRDSVRFPRIREVLVQYRDFLEHHVLPNRKRDKYMDEIEQLIGNGFFAAATAIANALPNARANAMGALLKKVFDDKTISGTNVHRGTSEDRKRFGDPNSATDENPCHLFYFVSPQTKETVAVALAWDRESNRPGIGICCPDGGALGDELLRRFATKPLNQDASAWWPYWIWLDQVRSDASFFDSSEDQQSFCRELDEKFHILYECFNEVVAEPPGCFGVRPDTEE